MISFEDRSSIFFDIFGFDESDFYSFILSEPRTFQSFIERIIGIFESDIFPDHRDREHIKRSINIFEKLIPFAHIEFREFHREISKYFLSKMFFVKGEWYSINGIERRGRNH